MNIEEITLKSKPIFQAIQESTSILLTLHNAPDLDSIGSNLALKLALESIGKKVTLIRGDDNPSFSTDQISDLSTLVPISFSEVDFGSFDLLIFVDIPALTKISEHPVPTLPFPIKTIKIDHHPQQESFGDIELITGGISQCMSLFLLFNLWDIKISPKIAQYLYLGIVGDSGGFRYQNIDSETFEIASKLVGLGAKPIESSSILEYRSLTELKIIGKVLSKIKTYFNDKLIISSLTDEDLNMYKTSRQEMRTVFKIILAEMDKEKKSLIKVMLYQKPNSIGEISVSFRGNNPSRMFDLNKIATTLGGGGHTQASSCQISGSFEEAEKIVVKTISDQYPELVNAQ